MTGFNHNKTVAHLHMGPSHTGHFRMGNLLAGLLLCALSTTGFAQSHEEPTLNQGIVEEQSFEELALTEDAIRSSGPTLSCFVDTSAYDQFTPGGCIGFEFGGPRTTTAVFQVFNINPAEHSFVWSAYGCSGYQCVTSVTAYRPKVVDVTITNNQTGQQWQLSAEAIYENGY